MLQTQRSAEPKKDGLGLFFGLTFAFSWLLCWIPAALTGQTNMQFPTLLLYLLGGFGPSIIGVILTRRFGSPDERRDFWRSLVDFKRIRSGWYALILLIFPVTFAISIGLNALLAGEAPGLEGLKQIIRQPLWLIPLLILGLLGGPLAEELGWRGFALDRMLKRWGLTRSSLLLGVIWWAWHLPLFFIRGTTQFNWGLGTEFFWLFLANIFPSTFLMSWAYTHNHRSILSAVLLHFMLNFTHSLVFPIPVQVQVFQTILLYLIVIALQVKLIGWKPKEIGERSNPQE